MRYVVFFGEGADGTDNYVTCVAYVMYVTYKSYTTYTGRASRGRGCGETAGGGPGRCGRGAAARGLTCR